MIKYFSFAIAIIEAMKMMKAFLKVTRVNHHRGLLLFSSFCCKKKSSLSYDFFKDEKRIIKCQRILEYIVKQKKI